VGQDELHCLLGSDICPRRLARAARHVQEVPGKATVAHAKGTQAELLTPEFAIEGEDEAVVAGLWWSSIAWEATVACDLASWRQ
jgi:hypothetical protein